jgi:ATP-dependent Clp protease ATP-binding subunit ClpA
MSASGEPLEPGDSGKSAEPGATPGPPSGLPPAAGPAFSGRRFDKFTERAKRVLVLAQEEARGFSHNYIGTEHLLLGLIREEEGIAAHVLRHLGVEITKARSALELIIGRGDRLAVGQISITPRVKRVFDLAVDEAKRLGHNHIGTEHLLLGLVREGEGIATGILESMGLSTERLRAQMIQAMASPEARAGEPAPAARNNVLTCRVDDRDLAAIDTLLEAGVRTTRSEAASWLIHAGIAANRALFEQVEGTVAEIRRLRGRAQSLAQQAMDSPPDAPPDAQRRSA